jgi:hypothetical protein
MFLSLSIANARETKQPHLLSTNIIKTAYPWSPTKTFPRFSQQSTVLLSSVSCQAFVNASHCGLLDCHRCATSVWILAHQNCFQMKLVIAWERGSQREVQGQWLFEPLKYEVTISKTHCGLKLNEIVHLSGCKRNICVRYYILGHMAPGPVFGAQSNNAIANDNSKSRVVKPWFWIVKWTECLVDKTWYKEVTRN